MSGKKGAIKDLFRKMSDKKTDAGPLPNSSQQFFDACEAIRQNTEKFLNEIDDESSSEEELDESAIIQKALFEYSCKDDGKNVMKITECLKDVLTSGAVICLICIESVKRNDKIWSCRYCYGILHLHCIQKWAKDSMHHFSVDAEERKDNSIPKWCCPKCRSEYLRSEQLQKYLCFCGKVENPVFDTWSIPHSCGKSCEKKLKSDCNHICSLLCHPGPCPPCPQTISITCWCAKSKPVSKRCSNRGWSCGKKCGKILTCGLHSCEYVCHEGPCKPCNKQKETKCLCGNESKQQPCETPVWQCDRVCSKPLKCGIHFCEVMCHSGTCPDCPNSKPRTCPCEKQIMVLPCTENVRTCGDTCNKLLACGLHRCSQRCHFGPCEECLQMRVIKCRCGQREKSMPCCREYICDTKCKRKRDCGKHYCNRKCCIGECPPCEVFCRKYLNCGRHTCTSICHPGPCYPCRESITISCSCGTTKVEIPCGRNKSSLNPKCSAYCRRPSDCLHPERHKHKCHFEACPPCQLPCGKKLSCGHICPVKCHTAVPTKISTKEKKDGPWDLINSFRVELVEKACPPCKVPVPVECLGGHEIQNIPCYEAKPRSCGRSCGRQLPCGNHTCKLECHKVPTLGSENLGKLERKLIQECEKCEEICLKPRKPGCNHSCLKSCHPGDCDPCQQHIKMKCHCGINNMYIICKDWTEADENKKLTLKCCSNRCPKMMSCGHRCVMSCHEGDCATGEKCKKKIKIFCPCKRQKKEVPCFMLSKTIELVCNDDCILLQETVKAEKLANEQKLNEEKKRKQEQEFLEFIKKTEGKKRKRKKFAVKEIDNKSNYSLISIFVSATVLCILGVLFMYYFFE